MLRRLMLAALAISAILALAGCGANQLMAPEVATEVSRRQQVLGRPELPSVAQPPRTDDPKEREGDWTETGAAGADTLFWIGDPIR